MADAYLNNDISALVKAAYGQLVGEDDIDTLDLADFCETGKSYSNLIANNAWKEQFTKALLQQCVKNFYTDTSYREEYRDPFFKDSRRFGALCQMISAELPDGAVQESENINPDLVAFRKCEVLRKKWKFRGGHCRHRRAVGYRFQE